MDRKVLILIIAIVAMLSATCMLDESSAPGDGAGSDGTTSGKIDLGEAESYTASGVADTGSGAASWSYSGSTLSLGSGSVGTINLSGSWGDWTLIGLVVDGEQVPESSLSEYTPADIFGTVNLLLNGSISPESGAIRALNVRNVTFGEEVTSVPASMFSGCTTLVSVTLGSGVTAIGDGAFSGCTMLSGVTTTDSLATIGERAFSGCLNLVSIDIRKASVELDTFSGCTRLSTIAATGSSLYTVDGDTGLLLSDGGRTVYLCPPGHSSGIIVLDDLTDVTRVYLNDADVVYVVDAKGRSEVTFTLLDGARASSLTYSSLGMASSSIASLSGGIRLAYTLYDSWDIVEGDVVATGLQYVVGDGHYTLTIGDGAVATFYPMGVSTLTYGDLAGMTYIGDWSVHPSGVPEGSLSEVVEDVDPVSVTVTGYTGDESAATLDAVLHFHGLRCVVSGVELTGTSIGGLRDLTMNGEFVIGDSAFQYCAGLRSLVANAVTSVGDEAFAYCTGLETVSFLSCGSFGDRAFASCWSLTSVTLGAQDVTIGDRAFDGCASLGVILADTDSDVVGNGDIPVVHFDTSDTADKSFTVVGDFLVVYWDHKSDLYYSDQYDSLEGASTQVGMYSGYLTIVPLSDGMFLRAEDGIERYEDWCMVVFDPGLGLDPEIVNIQTGQSLGSHSAPSRFGYTFEYWALDGSPYDFSSSVDESMVLTAVWTKNDTIDSTPFILLAIFAVSVAATFVMVALTHRMNR